MRSIRVVIGEIVSDNCQRMLANGYLEVADLVRQMTSFYKFDMNNEEIVDIISRFGDQYLDMRHNYGKLVIKDKAPTTVPNLATFGPKLRLSTKPSGMRLYAASEVSVVPTEGLDVPAGDDVTAKGRTRAQVMRCGLKFLRVSVN